MMRTAPRVALGDVSNKNRSTTNSSLKHPIVAVTQAPVKEHVPTTAPIATTTAIVSEVLPRLSAITPSTCVSSMLHSVGLFDSYAVTFMEHHLSTCAQLYEMNPEYLQSFFMCREHYDAVANALGSLKNYYVAKVPLPEVVIAPSLPTVERIVSIRINDPYSFDCLGAAAGDLSDAPYDEETSQLSLLDESADMTVPYHTETTAAPLPVEDADVEPLAEPSTCLIHFKHRQAEFSCPFAVQQGQYVMVNGDRGQDLGLVLRVNNDQSKGYVERTGPQGSVMRLAYNKEVEYYNTVLRAEEEAATEICCAKVQRLGLNMEVHFAEFQYDKKKLTFYYESKARVDFVALLKDLYREFGCRIWMEKVPRNNIAV